MFYKIRIAALSALLGLGTVAAIPASAQADGIYFSFGSKPSVGLYHDYDRHYYRRWHRRPWHGHACTPHAAVKKASLMGLRHGRVTRFSHRNIRVSGRWHHRHYASIVFGRASHCPIVHAL